MDSRSVMGCTRSRDDGQEALLGPEVQQHRRPCPEVAKASCSKMVATLARGLRLGLGSPPTTL